MKDQILELKNCNMLICQNLLPFVSMKFVKIYHNNRSLHLCINGNIVGKISILINLTEFQKNLKFELWKI